jgi:hypothetical protein
MKINDFLLFCSGVSRRILDKCPDSERIKHSSIGASVLFTAILAMISSFYAFSLIFEGFWKSFFVATFWGMIIFNLDRFIVATLRKKDNFSQELLQVSPRLILSMVIAFVISKPLELEIFKSEINQIMFEQLSEKVASLEVKSLQKERELIAQRNQVEKEMKEYFLMKEKYYQDYKCECDGTCGTGKTGWGKECLRKKEKYEDFIQEFNEKRKEVDKSYQSINNNLEENKNNFLQEKKNLESNFSYGLMARLNALHSLDSLAPWTISLLILLVEIAPVLTKLFSPKGPYDNLLATSENNYKADYVQNIYKADQSINPLSVGTVQQSQLSKKEYLSEKQKMIKDLYKELGQELTKNLKK